MRKTGICPKCTHNRLLHVGAVADTGDDHTELHEMHLAIVFDRKGFFGDDLVRRAGKLSAVVCKACGYTELYVLDPAELQPDGKYVTELNGPEPTAPFR